MLYNVHVDEWVLEMAPGVSLHAISPHGMTMRIAGRIAGLVAALSIISFTGCAPSLPGQSFDKLTRTPALHSAHIGFSARSLPERKDLYKVNPEKLFVPASITKLFTSAVSLILLGPDFCFETGLYTDSPPADGVIKGNLFIRGDGDPTLSARFHNGGGEAVFAEWADRLVRLGVRRINGNIVGDGSLYAGAPLGKGWSWDDELYCFSAQIGALSFDDNCVSILVAPGSEPGDKGRITLMDRSGYVIVSNMTLTAEPNGESSVTITRGAENNQVTVTGRVPFDSSVREYRVAVHNPALFAAINLKHVLESKGISVTGNAVDHKALQSRPAYQSLHLLALYTSPPLAEIIKQMNKPSQNLYAELLFLTLGNLFGGEASAGHASRVVGETLSRMGIPPRAFFMYDGSGLSRLNLVEPSAVIELLDYMYHHEHFRYFLESLPVAGVDGTLRTRMRNTEAEGIVRAKTGTLTHVRNLAGYVDGGTGELVAFAIMTNNYAGPVEELKDFQDSLCIALSSLVD